MYNQKGKYIMKKYSIITGIFSLCLVMTAVTVETPVAHNVTLELARV